MDKNYTDINAAAIDGWVKEGWIWSSEITHEQYQAAQNGDWSIVLTPTKPVPREWFGNLCGAKLLGLASAGGQQMPILTAAGAKCTVLDYSPEQLKKEQLVQAREGYEIEIIRGDMTKPLPFADESFDIIFHPVSNCFVEDVCSIWRECARVLKKGGRLLAGFGLSTTYAFDDEGECLARSLPYNPLKDKALYDELLVKGESIEFSHTVEDQIGGQLKAGLKLVDIYEDITPYTGLGKHGVPEFYATLAIKE